MNIYLIIIIIIVLLLALLILTKKIIKKTEIDGNVEVKFENQVKPLFCSSFIQYWLAQSWNYDRWIKELTMLKDIGINEIILQDIVDTKDKYAVYFTGIPGYTCNEIDMVETALKAAECLNMNVRIGLGFNKYWWIMNAFSQRWLDSEAKINKIIIAEIVKLFGTYTSFTGWYIPYEFHQLSALTKTQQSHLNNFLKQITSEIKGTDKNSVKDIMIAPFYNSRFSFLVSIPTWSKMIVNILNETRIDIVALQDGIGSGIKMKMLDTLYSYTKKATDSLDIKLYADTETFAGKSYKFISAPQERILKQISIERKYVQGFVAFSINHYQNRNTAGQESNYENYFNYYTINK